MSDPTRYTESMPDISYGMDESKKGEYVLYKDYAKLQAENERLRKAVEWQPIETAPKGMEVLVVEYGYIYIGIFDKDGYCDDTEGAGLDPSHWMPIPPFNEQAKGVQS